MLRLFTLVVLFSVVMSYDAEAKRNDRHGRINAPIKISIIGDGLISGFGLFNKEESYVGQFKAHFASKNPIWRKVELYDHSQEGLNTSTAYQYLPALLKDNADLVIVSLGYNDAMAQIDISTMYNNLDNVLTELHRNRKYVMLLQPKLPQHIEHAYVSRFNDMYSKLIARFKVATAPDFMKNIVNDPYALDNSSNYPTALGATYMLENSLPSYTLAIRSIMKLRKDLYNSRY